MLDYLGNASMAREGGDRGQHVEEAIACYESAVELAGPEDGQLQARLLNNLAAAYAQRPRGDRAGNIARSLGVVRSLEGPVGTKESGQCASNTCQSALGEMEGDR